MNILIRRRDRIPRGAARAQGRHGQIVLAPIACVLGYAARWTVVDDIICCPLRRLKPLSSRISSLYVRVRVCLVCSLYINRLCIHILTYWDCANGSCFVPHGPMDGSPVVTVTDSDQSIKSSKRHTSTREATSQRIHTGSKPRDAKRRRLGGLNNVKIYYKCK